jgi:hypothetical protein
MTVGMKAGLKSPPIVTSKGKNGAKHAASGT